MPLKEIQDLLARLYTDPELRARFDSDPDSVGSEFGLDASESAGIAAVVTEDLEYFSKSLIWKRLRAVEKLMPETRSALGPDFADRFHSFAVGGAPESVKKHLDDALRFAEQLIAAGVAADSAAIDRARLRFFGVRRRLVLKASGRRPWLFVRIGRREIIL